jgi:predicted transcriptional regulator
MPYHEKKFDELLVGDVFERIVKKPSMVQEDALIGEAIDQMLVNPLSRKVYVVATDGKYVGTVNTDTILRLIGYRVGVRDSGNLSFIRFMRDAFKEDVKNIMSRGRTITKDMKLTEAMKIMVDDHLNDLPVVDQDGKLVGELVSLELFTEGKRVFDTP